MESLHLQDWTRIGAMNRVEWHWSVRRRSMTGRNFDAPARVARWRDWFRPSARVSIGEPWGFPLERFVLLGPWPGTERGHCAKANYDYFFLARVGSDCC